MMRTVKGLTILIIYHFRLEPYIAYDPYFPIKVAVVIGEGWWPHFGLIYALSEGVAQSARVDGVILRNREKLPDHQNEQEWTRARWSEKETLLYVPKWEMFYSWIWVFKIHLIPKKEIIQEKNEG